MYNDGFSLLGILTGGLGIFILIVYILINTILTGWLAGQKGYSVGSWVALSLFFGPIAFLTLGFAPNVNTEATLNSIKSKLDSINLDSISHNGTMSDSKQNSRYIASSGSASKSEETNNNKNDYPRKSEFLEQEVDDSHINKLKNINETWDCPNCNKKNDIGDRSCSECGIKLWDCPNCNTTNTSKSRTCKECGETISSRLI